MTYLLYILTSIWVLSTQNDGQNLIFFARFRKILMQNEEKLRKKYIILDYFQMLVNTKTLVLYPRKLENTFSDAKIYLKKKYIILTRPD